MGGRLGLLFPSLFLLCRAVVELRCRQGSATLPLSLTSTTNEAFPKKGPSCWCPLFSGFILLLRFVINSLGREILFLLEED